MTRCAPEAVADAGRGPGKTLAVDGQRLRSAPHLIAGDRADSLEHGLHAAYTGPGPRCRTRASAALCGVTQVATPRVGNPATIRYSPHSGLAERFTCKPRARIAARSTPSTSRVTTVGAAVRLRAGRHATCSARAGEPRSTPERACFTTCADATLACAAREVTLYLALTLPVPLPVPLPPPRRSND
jgi:hypothetical protein